MQKKPIILVNNFHPNNQLTKNLEEIHFEIFL